MRGRTSKLRAELVLKNYICESTCSKSRTEAECSFKNNKKYFEDFSLELDYEECLFFLTDELVEPRKRHHELRRLLLFRGGEW